MLVYYYFVAFLNLVFEDGAGYQGFDVFLDETAERTGTELWFVAVVCDVFLGRICELDGDLSVFESLVDGLYHEVCDVADVVLAERLKHYDLIKSVQELRSEVSS